MRTLVYAALAAHTLPIDAPALAALAVLAAVAFLVRSNNRGEKTGAGVLATVSSGLGPRGERGLRATSPPLSRFMSRVVVISGGASCLAAISPSAVASAGGPVLLRFELVPRFGLLRRFGLSSLLSSAFLTKSQPPRASAAALAADRSNGLSAFSTLAAVAASSRSSRSPGKTLGPSPVGLPCLLAILNSASSHSARAAATAAAATAAKARLLNSREIARLAMSFWKSATCTLTLAVAQSATQPVLEGYG